MCNEMLNNLSANIFFAPLFVIDEEKNMLTDQKRLGKPSLKDMGKEHAMHTEIMSLLENHDIISRHLGELGVRSNSFMFPFQSRS